MSGPVGERVVRYADEADRLPVAQGIFVLVGDPFVRGVGHIDHVDGETFEMTQDRIRLTVVAFDVTLGEATSYSFSKHRASVEHLMKATREETETIHNLIGQELFLSYGKLFEKSSIQLLFPLGGLDEFKRLRKLSQLVNTPGRARVNKQGVDGNREELETMIVEIMERKAVLRKKEDEPVDDGVMF